MGVTCAIPGCSSSSKVLARQKTPKKVGFFKFPNDPYLQEAWKKNCYFNKSFKPTYHRVCSDHFSADDFEDMFQAQFENRMPRRLKKTAIPNPAPRYPLDKNGKYKNTNKKLKKTKTEARKSKARQCKKQPKRPTVSPQKKSVRREPVSPKERTLNNIASAPTTTQQLPVENCEMIYIKEELPPKFENTIVTHNLLDTPAASIENTDKVLKILLNKYNRLLSDHEELKKENVELQKIVKQYENHMDSKIEGLLSNFLTPSQLKILLQRT